MIQSSRTPRLRPAPRPALQAPGPRAVQLRRDFCQMGRGFGNVDHHRRTRRREAGVEEQVPCSCYGMSYRSQRGFFLGMKHFGGQLAKVLVIDTFQPQINGSDVIRTDEPSTLLLPCKSCPTSPALPNSRARSSTRRAGLANKSNSTARPSPSSAPALRASRPSRSSPSLPRSWSSSSVPPTIRSLLGTASLLPRNWLLPRMTRRGCVRLAGETRSATERSLWRP